jgi:hypothetical protein
MRLGCTEAASEIHLSHRERYQNHPALVRLFRDHAPVANLVSNRGFGRADDGALKPKDRLVDPIVVPRRIGFSLLATDRSLNQALFTLIHHITR